jgi:hypothetical protein
MKSADVPTRNTKRRKVSQSTERLLQRSSALRQPGLTLGLVPVAMVTAVTTHSPLHADLGLSLLASVLAVSVLLGPQLLVAATFAALYALITTVSVLAGMIYVVFKRQDPAQYFMMMLVNVTNAAVSFQTRTTMALVAAEDPKPRDTQSPAPEVSAAVAPLPPAPGAAREEDTPYFWQTMQVMAPRDGGRPDIVPGQREAFPAASGRHARPAGEALSNPPTDRQPSKVMA